MNLVLTTQEALEELVQSSVRTSIRKYFDQKESDENKPVNLTVKETATHLGVAELTVRNYIKRGIIKAERIGNRIIINRALLEKSLKEVKSLKYKR